MSYNEKLAARVSSFLELTPNKVEAIQMFSGICFMVNDKMCAGVQKDRLMVRINPELFDGLIEQHGCIPMDITGKIMKGYVFVDPGSLTTKKQLAYWLRLALDYNPIAKASKKRKTKIQL